MAKYLIEFDISSSVEDALVSDLNVLSHILYSAGGSVIDLDVNGLARQLMLTVEAEAQVVQDLLQTRAANGEQIKSISPVGQGTDAGIGEVAASEWRFAGFFQSLVPQNAMAVPLCPH